MLYLPSKDGEQKFPKRVIRCSLLFFFEIVTISLLEIESSKYPILIYILFCDLIVFITIVLPPTRGMLTAN